jgi:hypothetical protein
LFHFDNPEREVLLTLDRLIRFDIEVPAVIIETKAGIIKKDVVSEERTLNRLQLKQNGFWTVVRNSQVEAVTMMINNPIRLTGISIS